MQVLDSSHVLSSLDIWMGKTGCSVIAREVACPKWVKIHLEYQCQPVLYFPLIRSHHEIC